MNKERRKRYWAKRRSKRKAFINKHFYTKRLRHASNYGMSKAIVDELAPITPEQLRYIEQHYEQKT